MPVYDDLRPESDFAKRDYARIFPNLTKTEQKRIIDNLLRLKAALKTQVPARKTESNLLMASWNIKEFGHTKQRLPEAYFYMAEIISTFDLVAIQEIKSTLHDLSILMRLLGDDWLYVVNDITEGTAGNSERSGYLYNKRRVTFSGLAGELILWEELLKKNPPASGAPKITQLKRAPYITGFVTGWKAFSIINLHLHPSDDADDVKLRREEVRLMMAALKEKKNSEWAANLVITGDMNLYQSKDQETIKLITDAGYRECEGLDGKDTNVSKSEAYDRMFFSANKYFQFAQADSGSESGDVLDFFQHVYTDDGWRPYKKDMLKVYGGSKDIASDETALVKYYKGTWRRNQMSDHFPIWVEMTTDNSAAFLQSKRKAL